MLTDKSVRELLDAFGSAEPTPGGGSASALASAIGASLLMMVAALPKTRSGSDAERSALAGVTPALADIERALVAAIDRDAASYDRVVAAYRLPKTTDAEKSARRKAIDAALRVAAEVPLGVARLSVQALERAAIVAAHGNRRAATDVGVAIGLIRAGLEGAELNVDVNLQSIADTGYTAAAADEIRRLQHEGAKSADAARALLNA